MYNAQCQIPAVNNASCSHALLAALSLWDATHFALLPLRYRDDNIWDYSKDRLEAGFETEKATSDTAFAS